MGTDLSIKPSSSSEKSASSLKNLILAFGCGSLIVSAACFVVTLIAFISMLSMAAGDGARGHAYVETQARVVTILLVLSPIVAVVAGIIGIILVILWGIEKLIASSTNRR